MFVDFQMDAVDGARRTPGRLKTGGVPPKPPATILLSLWPSVFWDFGSLFSSFRGHFSRAVAAAVSSSSSLRRPRLCVAAHASRTSHSRCSCSSRRCGVLYHVMSRQACLSLLHKTLRRHSMSAVAAQTMGLSRFSERCSHICLRVVDDRLGKIVLPFFIYSRLCFYESAAVRPAIRGGCWSELSGGQEAEGR